MALKVSLCFLMCQIINVRRNSCTTIQHFHTCHHNSSGLNISYKAVYSHVTGQLFASAKHDEN